MYRAGRQPAVAEEAVACEAKASAVQVAEWKAMETAVGPLAKAWAEQVVGARMPYDPCGWKAKKNVKNMWSL